MSLYYPPAQRGGILTDPKYEFFVNIFHLLYLSAKNRRHRHTPSEELAEPPFGYVRRTECHGLSPYDWKWALDFAKSAL